jgi:radical SAM superfamily enzyme YgiQ (UPF0313 family)
MRALLVSTYEIGRQPFGLASPAAWLRREGIEVSCADLARQSLPEQAVRSADLVAFHLPMHTATRLAAPVIREVTRLNSSARICAYGLYAPLNGDWLRSMGVHDILGGEFEAGLTAIAREVARAGTEDRTALPDAPDRAIPRLAFLVPDRSGLPPLAEYATLRLPDGRSKVVGYTEASRGCRHYCRHCPVVPIYDGQFRVVQRDVVLADIDAQVKAGARHVTFGDPDFLNGPSHALRIVEALHARHTGVTYDATIKVEHLLRHRELLPRLRDTGCLFVTSAVESVDDRVLGLLEKGHTRQDFLDVVALCRETGITLVPTFVAFHPWLTLEGYCELLDTIAALDLVDHVAPIQLAIRLLVPQGSRLLELQDMRASVGPFDPRTLAYQWSHSDARVDRLHEEVRSIVGGMTAGSRRLVFGEISALAHHRAGLLCPPPPSPIGVTVPYVDEPWYCCAEPI